MGCLLLAIYYDDGHGHGTNIAGIIAGQHNGFGVAGIAPNAEIYAVKTIKSDGIGELTTVLQGIDWAIENHMDIINLSFGDLEVGDALHEAVKKATQQGILVVAASGNEGTDSGVGNNINYPARHEEVISVASVNKNFVRSLFSSTGPMNDFAAPGEEIYSTYLNGQYATYQGTSLAAPHIVGLLALLMEQYPYLTADELREGLKLYAVDLGTPGHDEWYGFGLPKYKAINQQALIDSVNAVDLKKKIDTSSNQVEQLALKNEWNKQQLDELLVAFKQNPTTANYSELMEVFNKTRVEEYKKAKQKEIDQALKLVGANVEKVVATFEHKPTVYNYKKAQEELQNMPTIPAKDGLDERVNTALLIIAKPAMDLLDRYEKNASEENYKRTKMAIDRIPKSTVKIELVQRFEQLAKSTK